MNIEKNIKIKLSTEFSLYGKFSGSFNQPLFIIVHGLPGNMDEEFYYSATRWFRKREFSTFRFNLYGYQKDARQLMNCSLKTHSDDLDVVIQYFRKRSVKKIFIAGHSFGGLTILNSQKQNFDGVALWDPSYKISFIKTKYGIPGGEYIKEINGYLMKWGVNVIIGKEMAEEIDLLQWNSITKKFKAPFNIIIAEKGALKGAKKYLNDVKTKTDLKIIKGATHYFNDQEKMQEIVFKTSEKWFRRFIKN